MSIIRKYSSQEWILGGIYLFAAGLPISHVPPQFAIAIAFAGWLVHGFIKREWLVRWHPFLGFLAFYIGWNVLSSLFSARPLHSLAAVVDNEWALLIMLMMFWGVDKPETLKRILLVFLACSSLAMVYAVWQTFWGFEYYRGMELGWMGGYYRAVGFYGFYLTFAALAMIVFFLALSHAFELRERRIVTSVLALVSFLAIVGSFARSIWLSLAVGIPLFGFLRNKKIGITVTIALVALASIGILVEPALRYRAESIIDMSQNETRLNLWKTAIEVAKAHPLLGVGEDNWDHAFPKFKVEGNYDTTVHPHNDYLNVLASSGVPGLIAFLGMWVIALSTGFRMWRRSGDPLVRSVALGASLSLLGFLVGAFFQNYYGTFANCLGWWFTVGLIFCSYRVSGVQE
jgi:putative inorganic carbon (HCO3(-)) transporter